MTPRKPGLLAVLALVVAASLAAWATTRSSRRVEQMRAEVKMGEEGPTSVTFWSLEDGGRYFASGDPELLQNCEDWNDQVVEVAIENIPWSDMVRVVRVDALTRSTGFSVSSGIVK